MFAQSSNVRLSLLALNVLFDERKDFSQLGIINQKVMKLTEQLKQLCVFSSAMPRQSYSDVSVVFEVGFIAIDNDCVVVIRAQSPQ